MAALRSRCRHHLISYFLSNTNAKNYRNWIVHVKTIASHKWDVFLRPGVSYGYTK